MNVDRLLREVEKRLGHLPEPARAAVLEALKEELARERRRTLAREGTVQAERERRLEAETLRSAMEAITRQARLESTIDEVLKQLARIVHFDSCSVSLLEAEGRFRIIAARGFADDEAILGLTFRDELSDAIREDHWPISLADVHDDPRFIDIEGGGPIRSWAGIPLLVEGEIIGLLCLDRHRVDPFSEEDLHRARAVAFSAAAAIRRAQLLEQIRRYADLLENVLQVNQAVLDGAGSSVVGNLLLDGALRLGGYPAGAFAVAESRRVVAATGDLEPLLGREVPPELLVPMTSRLEPDEVAVLGDALGLSLPTEGVYLVPLFDDDHHLGTLSLLDPGGQSPDDRLLEGYARRAAAAYARAAREERSA